MSRPDRIDTDAPFDASIRTIDLRIAVGRHYNLGFEERVASANSNSLAAIYFTRRQLDVIGRDPSSLSLREAWRRYLNSRQAESTEESLKNYHYRLKLFVEWCEGQDVDRVGELSGWLIDSYENERAGRIAPVTLNGEMKDLRQFIRYLVRIDAVEPDLAEKVHIPSIPAGAETSDTILDFEAALDLLEHYRSTPARYGDRIHTLLEIAWHTGARLAALRGLDVRDVHLDDQFIEFRHRRETETPLKNKLEGERPVGIPAEVCDVLNRYIGHHRYDRHDEHGRQPLLTSSRGRAGKTTIRNWSYMATFPCHHTECPHGKDPATCEFKSYHGGSKCPSSRSPHQIRKGSITWQRDLGFPPEVVSERVDASLDVIETYYDKASPLERLERRRRQYVDQMDINQ